MKIDQTKSAFIIVGLFILFLLFNFYSHKDSIPDSNYIDASELDVSFGVPSERIIPQIKDYNGEIRLDSEENGDYSVYVVKSYEKDSKRYIDVDYFQELSGKDAAMYCFGEKGIDCLWPKELEVKRSEILKRVNYLSDDPNVFHDQFWKLYDEYGMYSFPNGVWLDVNENPKIRTFEVYPEAQILVSIYWSEYATNQDVQDGYIVSWDSLEKITTRSKGKSPFRITISGNKVVEISEIYRP